MCLNLLHKNLQSCRANIYIGARTKGCPQELHAHTPFIWKVRWDLVFTIHNLHLQANHSCYVKVSQPPMLIFGINCLFIYIWIGILIKKKTNWRIYYPQCREFWDYKLNLQSNIPCAPMLVVSFLVSYFTEQHIIDGHTHSDDLLISTLCVRKTVITQQRFFIQHFYAGRK